MSNIFRSSSVIPYKSGITLSPNQTTFLVNQVIDQLRRFYDGTDTRRIMLSAQTGGGKTVVTIKELIPKFIEEFYPIGKRVIGLIAPLKEVTQATYRTAYDALNNKTINGALIRVYDQNDITSLKERVAATGRGNLDGDVIVIILTSQYFNSNYAFLSANGAMFDLLIADEAHTWIGTISAVDTKADKGIKIKNFNPILMGKLISMPKTAMLGLSATLTNSQKEQTFEGAANNVYLIPMPKDILTTPFYDLIPYLDFKTTLVSGLAHSHAQCTRIGELIKAIDQDTWTKAKANFYPAYPVTMAKLSRNKAVNGLDLKRHLVPIEQLCAAYGFKLFVSLTGMKVFDGQKIKSMDEGVRRCNTEHDMPIVMLVIESGSAGIDIDKLNNVIIARDPSTTTHNNYSQAAGRASRMVMGFRNHGAAAEAIRNYDISDEQKRLLAEYYIEFSSSTVHVPAESNLLNGDVKDFIETDTFRRVGGSVFILKNVFPTGNMPDLCLSTSTTIQNNSYQHLKKHHCETCRMVDGEQTSCFYDSWEGLERSMECKISKVVFQSVWDKTLQVHHLDGDHFNNDPANLLTNCPNTHAPITIFEEHYNNRYPELHAELAEKKKANQPEMDMA